jgi:hypothetical protein
MPVFVKRAYQALILGAAIASCGRPGDDRLTADRPRLFDSTRTLVVSPAANVELPEPFTEIAAVRELPDGRVLVLDPRERMVRLVDLATGGWVRVGRLGRGPGEYAGPVKLVGLGGDSTGIVDALTRRILVVKPDGETSGVIALVAPPGVDRGEGVEGWLDAADDSGHFYSSGIKFRNVNGQVAGFDSIPILRWAPERPGTDTVAWVRLQGTQVTGSKAGKAEVIRVATFPFASHDLFAVAPDGSIAIAEPEPYRVRWIGTNGERTDSPDIPYTPLPLTQGHKEEWRERQAGDVTVMENGDTGERTVTPRRGPIQEPPWPDVLPPYLFGALRVAPDGKAWVRRTRPARMANRFDVINREGRVVIQVELPPAARLVGFGANGAVYAARRDSNDLEYLQRYRIR